MTKTTHFDVSYKFWPVGQGLFSSGKLRVKPGDSNEKYFHWVYDCGTMSKQELLKNSIKKYKKSFYYPSKTKSKIDLVVISHFDKDHISGLVELLKTFSIQTLLLPYMPLWQRLIIAFDEKIDSADGMFQFFINPVQYISAISEGSVNEILFVRPGNVRPGNEGDPDPENQGNSNKSSDDGGNLIINTARSDINDSSLIDRKKKMNVQYSGKKINVQYSREKIKIWEFIPYNDASVCFSKSASNTWSAFKANVAQHRDALLQSPNKTALDDIKKIYDRQFGSDSKSRNIISLFLYAGYPSSRRSERLYINSVVHSLEKNLLSRIYRHIHYSNEYMRAGVLYTGDGYLDTPDKLDKLLSRIGLLRIKKINCLQVMHHGSRANWYAGIAKTIEPYISIFCSDPSHQYNHPHGEVVRDFLKYNPVQVDTTNSVEIISWIPI